MHRTLVLLALSLLFPRGVLTQPFFTEAFEEGIPEGWENTDSTGQGFLWEHCANRLECPLNDPTFQFSGLPDDRFRSKTARNGYVFVDSRPSNGLIQASVSRLTTSPIDCSDKTEVFLEFSTLIVANLFSPKDHALVWVRAGDGPWQSFRPFPLLEVDPPDAVFSFNPQPVLLDISAVAAGQSEVQIRWEWTHRGEWIWALDDVHLYDHNPLNERVVWGDEPGQGDFDGGPNGWTTTSWADTCAWLWSPGGLVDNSLLPQKDFQLCSPGALNGAMVLNATFCVLEGLPTPFTEAELISPPMDLSAVPPGTRLALRFYQLVMVANPSRDSGFVTSILYSLDGGQSWSEPIDANPGLEFQKPFCGKTTLPLPEELAGQAQVRIKFWFAGSAFFWALDDVAVVMRPDNDLRIPPRRFAIAPNFQTPASQLTPFPLWADIENFGQKPQDFVTLRARIENVATREPVFEEQLTLGSLPPGGFFLDSLLPSLVVLPPEPALYEGRYDVAADLADAEPCNNRPAFDFEITEEVFAKDNGLRAGFTPNRPELRYEIGTVYYLPRGEGYDATRITFGIANAHQLRNRTLTIRLYEWHPDSLPDQTASPDEYELLGLNIFTIPNDAAPNSLFSVEPDGDLGRVPLQDDTYYMVTVDYANPDGVTRLFIGATDELNYENQFRASQLAGRPHYVQVLRFPPKTEFSTGGIGFQRIPVIRLHIARQTGVRVGDGERLPLRLAPNPVPGDRLQLFGEPPLDLGGGTVRIFDAAGREVGRHVLPEAFVSRLSIPVGDLSNGLYRILVLGNDGRKLWGSFVIQRP